MTSVHTPTHRFSPSSLSLASFRRWLLLLGATAFACVPPSTNEIPHVAPSSTLSPSEMARTQAPLFALIHAGPVGQALADPSIQLVFSRPLRELGPDVVVPNNLSITPDIPGHWEWVGAHGLTFVPQGGTLPRATKFTVNVPANLSSLGGSVLGAEKEFSFQTPLPRVLRSTPSRWGHDKEANAIIELTFSQVVQAQDVLPFFSAKAGETEVSLEALQGDTKKQVRFYAPRGFPLNSEITYELTPGWNGLEGPGAAEELFKGRFTTYGPLVAKVVCERDKFQLCRPEGGLSIELSNPVPALQFARSLVSRKKKLNADLQWEPEQTTRNLYLNAHMVPGDRFKIKAGRPIRDIFGQAIKFFKNSAVAVGDYRPSVVIGLRGDSLIGDEKHVPVLSMNTDYKLTLAPLQGPALRKLKEMPGKEQVQFLSSVPHAESLHLQWGKKNQTKKHLIDLNRLLASQGGRGAFAIAIEHENTEGRVERSLRWGQKTDIGITAKRGRKQSSFWVTSLSTGAPLVGAEISVVGGETKVYTDQEGMAQLPPGLFVSTSEWRQKPEWIKVRQGKDTLYRSSADSMGEWRLPVSTDFYGKLRDVAFLFPERNLFRPGESFRVKGYLRRPGLAGNKILINEALQLVLQSPDGEILQIKEVQTNTFGGYSAQFALPSSAPPGYFSLSTRRGKEVLTTSTLQVANYRPAEFEVKVSSLSAEMFAGQVAQFDVRASYFFGGVLRDETAHYKLTRSPAVYIPPGAEALVVNDDAHFYSQDSFESSRGSTMKSAEEKLDSLGSFTLKTPLLLPGQRGPERVELDAEITDASRQAQSARGSILVHAASFYLGLERPKSYFIDAPGNFEPQVVALRPNGSPALGQVVRLALERIFVTHVKQRSSGQSRSTIRKVVREPAGHCVLRTKKEPTSCSLKVTKAGRYIVRASATDKRGRNVHSSYSVYGLAAQGASGWRDEDEQGTVELKLDRETYRLGDTARVLIQSPFQKARAWITIERDGVLEQRVQEITGPSPSFEVKIDKKMRPNAFIGVHLIENRKEMGQRAHQVSDSFRFGYVNLQVDPEEQRLAVSVHANKKEYRPREEVELTLSVKDAQRKGKKAELTVFVVDEGVLALSGYSLPDPLKEFTKERPLRVETIEARESIGRVFGLLSGDQANKGDPGGDGGDARVENITTAYFNPSVITDDQGRARVKFLLPDNLGRFRVMVLAVSTDDRYGKGSGSLTINKKLMVRPALPRFLRAGDTFQASVLLSSRGMQESPVSVKFSVEGLQVIGEAQKSVKLPADGTVEVFFEARASKVGQAKIRFAAQGGGHWDSVAYTRKIQSPGIMEAVAVYGKTKSAEAHRLGDMTALRSDRGGLDITLSSTALVGLEGSIRQLENYPYACTEQLSSRTFPLLFLKELSQKFAIAGPKNSLQEIGENVGKILQRQRGDGGFGLWPDSQRSSPWVSAYALWVVVEGQRLGISVPARALERGKRYLQSLVVKRQVEDLPAATFAAFTLSKLGHGDPHSLHALFEKRQQMPVFSRFLLLWAAAEELKDEEGPLIKTLLHELESLISLRGNRAEISWPHGEETRKYMGSNTRLHALALNALLAAKPDHALAANLVRALLDARKGGKWGNTQESAFSLLALNAYFQTQEHDTPQFEGKVFFADQLLGSKTFRGRSVVAQSFKTPMKKLAGGQDLIFQKLGNGSLFFEARLRYVRKQLPTKPLESGFLVSKSMRAVTREELEGVLPPGQELNVFQGGDLVLVELRVLAPETRRFVVIDDPLPAGLEAVDMSLATSSSALSLGEGTNGYSHAWYRQEIKDDRVLHFVDEMPGGIYRYRYLARATTKGVFVLPPTRALEMYQEEVYGRTAARTVSIQ